MESILFEIIDKVATLTLHRPERYNSFNRSMALELQKQLEECADNQSVRAIFLTGSGKAFCAGQDLQEVIAPDAPALTTILKEHYNPIIRRIRQIEKPVLCGVNGVAAGAGANLAIACDITVAAESAVFIQAFSKIGLIPDSGGTFFLPRLVGMQRASALMMLGENISAKDAAAMGMIYKTFPDNVFREEAFELALKLASMPTKGLGLTKRALNQSLANDLVAQLVVEDELQSIAGNTADYKEGVRAFLQKRKPVFKGR